MRESLTHINFDGSISFPWVCDHVEPSNVACVSDLLIVRLISHTHGDHYLLHVNGRYMWVCDISRPMRESLTHINFDGSISFPWVCDHVEPSNVACVSDLLIVRLISHTHGDHYLLHVNGRYMWVCDSSRPMSESLTHITSDGSI